MMDFSLKYVLALLLLVGVPWLAGAQISGRVVSAADGEPLTGATVLLESAAGKHLAYCLADKEGHFAFKTTPKDASYLSISLMSYATEKVPLEGATFPLTVRLREEAFELKEVAVQAKSIIAQGDTVTYLTSAFAQKSDHSIGDVMKRMPGIEVEKSGKVLYQGKEINRFYIEGKDLLGGQYGVATKGVSADDIGAVEVMENHQPLQVLQGISLSDQAAINLKLKDGRKSAWLVHGSAGGGYMQSPRRGLFGGDLFALRASSGSQSLVSLKGNNTGLDLSEEQIDFTLRPRATDLQTPLELSLLSSAALLPKRTLLNRDGLISINHLTRLSPTLQAQLSADYLEDHRSATGERRTTYLSPKGDQEITEGRADRSRHRMARGRMVLEANQPSYYLSNTTRAQLDREQLDLRTTGTFANQQIGQVSDLYLSNDLQCIRRIAGDHLLFLRSVNEWESLPSHLTIVDGETEGRERITDRAFSTDESIRYDYLFTPQFSLGVEAGLKGLFRRLGSEGEGDLPLEVTAAQRLDMLGLSLSPTLKWRQRGTEIELGLPLEYSHYSFGGVRDPRGFVLLSPSLSVRVSPIHGLSLSAGAAGGRSPISASGLYQGQWMTDYRTIRSGYEELLLRPSYRLSAAISYRDLSRGLFSHLILLHNGSESPYKVRRELREDGLVYLRNELSRSRMQTTSVIGRLNMAIGLIHGGGSLQTLYTHTVRDAIAEGEEVRFGSDLLTIKGMLNTNLTSRLFLLYQLSYSGSRLSVPRGGSPAGVYSMTHTLEATYTPIDPLTLILRGEHYVNRISPDLTKQMTMVDLDITWSVSKKVELEAGLHNLLNNDHWSYTTYGQLLRQTVDRQLRGRTLLLTLRVK